MNGVGSGAGGTVEMMSDIICIKFPGSSDVEQSWEGKVILE